MTGSGMPRSNPPVPDAPAAAVGTSSAALRSPVASEDGDSASLELSLNDAELPTTRLKAESLATQTSAPARSVALTPDQEGAARGGAAQARAARTDAPEVTGSIPTTARTSGRRSPSTPDAPGRRTGPRKPPAGVAAEAPTPPPSLPTRSGPSSLPLEVTLTSAHRAPTSPELVMTTPGSLPPSHPVLESTVTAPVGPEMTEPASASVSPPSVTIPLIQSLWSTEPSSSSVGAQSSGNAGLSRAGVGVSVQSLLPSQGDDMPTRLTLPPEEPLGLAARALLEDTTNPRPLVRGTAVEPLPASRSEGLPPSAESSRPPTTAPTAPAARPAPGTPAARAGWSTDSAGAAGAGATPAPVPPVAAPGGEGGVSARATAQVGSVVVGKAPSVAATSLTAASLTAASPPAPAPFGSGVSPDAVVSASGAVAAAPTAILTRAPVIPPVPAAMSAEPVRADGPGAQRQARPNEVTRPLRPVAPPPTPVVVDEPAPSARLPAHQTQVESVVLEPGGQIGDYDLIEQIGEGGMAVIFKARHRKTGQIVAIKALHAHQQTTLAGQRFSREFRAMKALSHPHVVHMYEMGVVGHQAFVAMEFVEGHDLKAHLKVLKELEPAERWLQIEQILKQLCSALDHIHKRGLIHRDLKPSNILLTRQNQVKLTDFGVAKNTATDTNQLTQPGMLVGTLAYLAPEVFEQGVQGRPLDLYALGVMLYVMLTDKLPFTGKNIVQIMQRHLKHFPDPPIVVRPEVPQYLSDITMKLLEKRADDRYQSALEVTQAIEAGRKSSSHANEEDDFDPRALDDGWQPRLVGRADAMQVIVDALQRLSHEQKGGVLVVEGPEGSGRSRLVSTGLERAQSFGLPVYSGRCLSGPQLWCEGFRGVFRDILVESDRTRESGLPATRVPAVSQALRLSEIPLLAQTPEASPAEDLEGDIMSLLRQLLLKSPRVVWIDDLDYADPGTLVAVGELMKQVIRSGFPILLVITVQPQRIGFNDRVFQLFSSPKMAPYTQHLRLGNLTRDDVQQLLLRFLPDEPRTTVLLDWLYLQMGGMPMATVERIRFLMDRRGLLRPEGEVRWTISFNPEQVASRNSPAPSLQWLIRQRLASVPPSSLLLLKVLALWGREVPLGQLVPVLRATEEQLLEHLRFLERKAWVVQSWLGGVETYRLGHPCYQSLLLQETSAEEAERIRRLILNKVPSAGGGARS